MKEQYLTDLIDICAMFTPDFMADGRDDSPDVERDWAAFGGEAKTACFETPNQGDVSDQPDEDSCVKTLTLAINDQVKDQFLWLLGHFSRDEIRILEQSDHMSDDEYLRSIAGMVDSIQDARQEPLSKGVDLDHLEW